MNNQQRKSKVFISHAIFNRIWLLVIALYHIALFGNNRLYTTCYFIL